MARTYSTMMSLGTPAPSFNLPAANPEADGKSGDHRSLDDYTEAEAVLVVFTCNHCPYAVHVEPRLISIVREFQKRNVAFVAISSNDASRYPEDSFENMSARAAEKAYPFVYLYDETQEVARAYNAACTPDLYLFDKNRKLVYRGRLDDGRPGNDEITSHDLKTALEQLLAGGNVTVEQIPSIGCDIKWKDPVA